MNVGDWLRGLGLGQYDAVFHENGVDSEVLPDLTDGDLEKLGVLLGHRKRLLKAIANLVAIDAPTTPKISAAPASPTDAAERRQLTVMFCDLVGSTALSTRLDPEDFGDLIRAFQGAVTKTAARFEGYVAKFMGDGALVYFGYPKAHEDDVARAARAGLGIVEVVRTLRKERGVALEVRAGLATGLVVDALQQSGLEAKFMELELTESLIVQDVKLAVATMDELRRLGVRLSIDDFGTGYSSLSALKTFPVEQLKIDRSFVDGLPADTSDQAVARAVISLGHELKMRVIAEGVESEAQAQFLRENDCDEMQGYLFSRPVRAQRIEELLSATPG